jgi:hypothetical protein
MPPVTSQGGEATTWSSIYSEILQPYCVSCHRPNSGYVTTLFMDQPDLAYSVLLGQVGNGPTDTTANMPFISPQNPERSYLYLRVTGAKSPRMPMNGELPQAAIDALESWIAQGAQKN